MASIFRRHFKIHFIEWKCMNFRLKFQWNLFLRFELIIFSNGSDNCLAPSRRQAIIWTNDGIVYWRIFTSLGLNELTILLNNTNIIGHAPRNILFSGWYGRLNFSAKVVTYLCPFCYTFTWLLIGWWLRCRKLWSVNIDFNRESC